MIREYTSEDKARVIALIDFHIPNAFAAAEKDDFINYLDQEIEDYFVAEIGGKIIGSGGINYFTNENHARISWDIIHPNYQGQGIGRLLLEHRLNHIKAKKTIKEISVRTSQTAYIFYQKAGFKTTKTVKDFWAPGFDLYEMKTTL